MQWTQYREHPIQFAQHCLRSEVSFPQEILYREILGRHRRGRFGIVWGDSVRLVETVITIALWRGLCWQTTSQIVTPTENTRVWWSEALEIVLEEARSDVQTAVHKTSIGAYRTRGGAIILWPVRCLLISQPSDVYFGDFEGTSAETVADVSAACSPDHLLILPAQKSRP